MKYRAEIDGLRAWAVLPVLMFHAGLGVTGGYAGVDVFFVISGYLITAIVWGEVQSQKFSILRFYERRARRILPALFFVLVVSALVAWRTMTPAHLNAFAHSLQAVGLFGSNFFFWKTSSYFDANADLKPLLHTWSLAVEEQYYLFFPPLLWVLARRGFRFVTLIFILMGLVSFGLAVAFVASKPESAFYLLPTRAWELLAGALVALALTRFQPAVAQPRLSEAAAALGFGLILFAYFAYGQSTPCPSAYTLAPVLGTVLILSFANKSNITGRFLASKIFVFVGLLSYSIYLWHQPIFAFARLMFLDELSSLQMLGLCGLSIALAYLSWRFVERPFRDAAKFSQASILSMSVVGCLFFIGLGALLPHAGKADARLSAQQLEILNRYDNDPKYWRYFTREGIPEKYHYECDFYDIEASRNGVVTRVPRASIPEPCYVRSPSAERVVLLWGDSHAQHHNYGLRRSLPQNWQVLQVASSGCPPANSIGSSRSDYCQQSNWFALQAIQKARPDVVLIARNKGHNSHEMREIADLAIRAGAKEVVWLGPTPHWSVDLPLVAAYHLWPNFPARTALGVNKKLLEQDLLLKAEMGDMPRVSYLSISEYFCGGGECDVYLGKDPIAGLTSWDYGHLTPLASEDFSRAVLAPKLLNLF